MRLRDVLALRLRQQRQRTSFQQSGYVYAKRPADPEPVTEELAQEATSMLDRVKLMRVFDVAGLVEAVGEITESCEQSAEVSAEIGVLKHGGVADSEDELSEEDILAESEGFESGDPAQLLESQNSGIIPIHDGGIGMVVIDTIADIFGPLMGKNQIQGNTTWSHPLEWISLFIEHRPRITHNLYAICAPPHNQTTNLYDGY